MAPINKPAALSFDSSAPVIQIARSSLAPPSGCTIATPWDQRDFDQMAVRYPDIPSEISIRSGPPLPAHPWPNKITNICCIGAGYVGGLTGTIMAYERNDIQVTVIDKDADRIASWNSMEMPINEPGLLGMVTAARDGCDKLKHTPNLTFSADIATAISQAQLIFLCVDTPTKLIGDGAGRAMDITNVMSAAQSIAEIAMDGKIVVEKSTVPVGTADSIREILRTHGGAEVKFEVLSNPEFLSAGNAIHDLMFPQRILIGSLDNESAQSAAAALEEVYTPWASHHKVSGKSVVVRTNLWSAELAKLAANALLAQRISSINSLSAICEATGADIGEVSLACGEDERIGNKMLKESVGFGGSCFKKDIMCLAYLAEFHGLPQVAEYWTSVVDVNEFQKQRFVKRVVKCLSESVAGKRVTILGFAFKKNTKDTRGSAAIDIVLGLVKELAQVCVYDPKVEEQQIWRALEGQGETNETLKALVSVASSIDDACAGSHAVIIANNCDEFGPKSNVDHHQPSTISSDEISQLHIPGKYINDLQAIELSEISTCSSDPGSDSALSLSDTLGRGLGLGEDAEYPLTPHLLHPGADWARISRAMKEPRLLFDGHNIVDKEGLEALGFRVEQIGKSR